MSWISNSIARSRGRSGATVKPYSGPVPTQEPSQLQLRELKKQTRMMAEKQNHGYGAGILFGMILAGALYGVADWLWWPIYPAVIVATSVLAGRMEYRRLTR